MKQYERHVNDDNCYDTVASECSANTPNLHLNSTGVTQLSYRDLDEQRAEVGNYKSKNSIPNKPRVRNNSVGDLVSKFEKSNIFKVNQTDMKKPVLQKSRISKTPEITTRPEIPSRPKIPCRPEIPPRPKIPSRPEIPLRPVSEIRKPFQHHQKQITDLSTDYDHQLPIHTSTPRNIIHSNAHRISRRQSHQSPNRYSTS